MRPWSVISGLALSAIIPAAVVLWLGNEPQVAAQQQTVTDRPVTVPVSEAPSVQVSTPTSPKPAPKPSWAKAPTLEAAVTEAAAGFPGRYSVAVVDLESGKRWTFNETARYHPASTIKMPVTLYAMEQHRAGKLSWDQLITYTKADFESPGGGAFETAPFGGKYPVENLVNRAIMYSNNVAVNMLGRHLGWENIRAWTRTIDGDLVRLPDGSPEVTVLSEVGWWVHLNRVAQEAPKEAELILGPLRQVAYDGRIAAGLPEGVEYVHKFGGYDGYFHDGGIIYADRPYVLVVMTHGATEGEADVMIAEVTSAVHQVMALE